MLTSGKVRVIISIHFCVQSGEAPKQMKLFTSYTVLEGPLHFFSWSWDKRGRPCREQPMPVRLGHQQLFHQWFHQWWLQLMTLMIIQAIKIVTRNVFWWPGNVLPSFVSVPYHLQYSCYWCFILQAITNWNLSGSSKWSYKPLEPQLQATIYTESSDFSHVLASFSFQGSSPAFISYCTKCTVCNKELGMSLGMRLVMSLNFK